MSLFPEVAARLPEIRQGKILLAGKDPKARPEQLMLARWARPPRNSHLTPQRA